MNPQKQKLFDECSDFLKVIAFRPVYTRICGSSTGGLLLSQLVYWGLVSDWKEFYKTNDEIRNEICLSRHQMLKAKQEIIAADFVSIRKGNYPKKTFYIVNPEKIIDAIMSLSEYKKSVVRKADDHSPKSGQPLSEKRTTNGRKADNIHTENTTENTTEKIYRIFDYWNAKKIIVHRQKTKFKPCIKLALKDYSEKEIYQAIDNYSEILNSSLHFWDHKWTLAQFLNGKGNVDRFLDRDQALKSFAKNKTNNRYKSQAELNAGGTGKLVV